MQIQYNEVHSKVVPPLSFPRVAATNDQNCSILADFKNAFKICSTCDMFRVRGTIMSAQFILLQNVILNVTKLKFECAHGGLSMSFEIHIGFVRSWGDISSLL